MTTSTNTSNDAEAASDDYGGSDVDTEDGDGDTNINFNNEEDSLTVNASFNDDLEKKRHQKYAEYEGLLKKKGIKQNKEVDPVMDDYINARTRSGLGCL